MEEEATQLKYYDSQTLHFFKIVLHDTLQSEKLSFPKRFVRHHGGSFCLNKVSLRVPSGDVWEVELHTEEDDGMWLLNGWQEFVEFYHIKFGYFLVFCYQGNSEFQVLIFDKSTSEIKYPYKCSKCIENHADVGPCSLPVTPEIEERDVGICSEKWLGDSGASKSFGPKKSRETLDAVIRTRSFHSPNPHFQIIMQSTHLSYNFILGLPAKFMRDHIGQKECNLKLFVTSGRFWTVKFRFRMWANKPTAKIYMGWKPFAQDNNLGVGDVCVFELIDSVQVHFQVTVFRAAVDGGFGPIPVNSETRECPGRQIMLKPPCHEEPNSDIQYAATSKPTSKYPFFDLIITKALLKRHDMPIPRGFLKHLKQSTHNVTLKVAGRLWHVRVCFGRQRRGGMFSNGWSQFVRENFLQVGDVCVFELIKKEEMVLKVSIHKGGLLA